MKKYLNTPEEVIKALKDGKEVKGDDGYCCKMIDGVICIFVGGGWVVGAGLDDEENPYIEEAEPLKLEVGKYYKNRKGRKFICCFVGEGRDDNSAVMFTDISNGHLVTTSLIGRYLTNEQSDYDIIGEWEEK